MPEAGGSMALKFGACFPTLIYEIPFSLLVLSLKLWFDFGN